MLTSISISMASTLRGLDAIVFWTFASMDSRVKSFEEAWMPMIVMMQAAKEVLSKSVGEKA